MTCKSCVSAVERALGQTQGINRFDIDLEHKKVTVVGTGKTVIVRGQSSATGENLGAAVCMFHDSDDLREISRPRDVPRRTGLARFVQLDANMCAVDITVSGLKPGPYGVAIHTNGNISQGAITTGNIYRGTAADPSDPSAASLPAGVLGDINVEANGWGSLLVETRRVRLDELIGRSLVVTERTSQQTVADTGGPADGILCGIIARSAGAFQNNKRICECSGKTLWEEAQAAGNTNL
ncbi:copper chaperone [Tieghemiomyces parasiticus]|uniref:Superoxide dismutase 1 copper chaperone n=1 Tax=Tieghemiomyces parasiticus TaxID=78921 RepID=A0A9W8ACE1_9FUNG|nr:copper chaperone [Tieghemiomyces parasiticus]